MKWISPVFFQIKIILFCLLYFHLSFAQGGDQIYPGLIGQELINQLRSTYRPVSVLGYDTARDTMFARIDNHDGEVICVYSGYTISINPSADPSTDAYDKNMNTEHTWPQSYGADTGNPRSDLNHLYPVRENVNSSRSNDPFGDIVDAVTDTWWRLDYSQTSIPVTFIEEYSEKDNTGIFEPREDHKGNAARAVFYMYTMYSDQLDGNFFEIQKDVLRIWHNQEPADQAELNRTNRIAPYQSGKVNPFILDSTLVRRAYFPDDIPGIANPSVFIATVISELEIELSWTRNASYDDVMIVWNTSGSFSAPEDGTTYSDGHTALNGTIIARQSGTSFSHTGLEQGSTYYYRAFSVHGSAGSELYSSGVSTSAGTGETYDPQPGDIIITEIMQNPNAVDDTYGEWFEVFNRTAYDIDINQWHIRDLGVDNHQISNGGPLIVPAESWLVLARNANASVNGGAEAAYQYSSFLLANADDEIVLLLSDGTTEIDRIVYDGGPVWPDPTGASIYYNADGTQENNSGSLWAVSDLPWPGSAGDFGTPGYGNTVSSLTGTIPALAVKYDLRSYPNPFNSVTTIRYNLTEAQYIRLAIYDINGREVLTIAQDEYQSAGLHEFRWKAEDKSGTDVASGLYVVSLQGAGFSQLMKIILVR